MSNITISATFTDRVVSTHDCDKNNTHILCLTNANNQNKRFEKFYNYFYLWNAFDNSDFITNYLNWMGINSWLDADVRHLQICDDFNDEINFYIIRK